MKKNTLLKYFLTSLFFLSLLSTACSSKNTKDNTQPAQSIEELKKQLEKILEDGHVPGMSVAIVHKDGQKFVAGIGKADVASNRAATADTLFRVGSTSKGFVSLSVLKLVEEGKLSLEDQLHEIAPEVWFKNRWQATDPIRVANLLEHTTGWDDVHFREFALEASRSMGLLEAFNYDHSSRISRWRPSTRMAYCNSGPPVAAYIVEKITGMRFEDYVAQNFFQPIGMKTATYFLPDSELTTLYRKDGTTPIPYWNIIYRPTGSINASANDMANYLLFYLNRGSVNGKELLPASAISRMESPTTTWAAKEGLKAGYGLSNYWSVYDGFVYHGHDGRIEGGITEMVYMPDKDVGYFYSINSDNTEAFTQIGKTIRAYITRTLEKPLIPSEGIISQHASEYSGWYELDSPREEQKYFLERLSQMICIRFKKNQLLMTSLGEKAVFLPVIGDQFRKVPQNESPSPVATVALLTPNAEGKFVQIGTGMKTMKRIPTWLAITEIFLVGFILLSFLSILIYAPFWIFYTFMRKQRYPKEFMMRLLPLVAVLSMICAVVLYTKFGEISRMGNLTGWSFSLFLLTIIFAVASVVNILVLWLTPKQEVRSIVRIYSMVVTIALVLTTGYLAYFGMIGLRMWA